MMIVSDEVFVPSAASWIERITFHNIIMEEDLLEYMNAMDIRKHHGCIQHPYQEDVETLHN